MIKMVVVVFKQVGLKMQLLLAIAFFPYFPVVAQDTGESLFKANCMACHTIGGGRLVGPDLKGVNAKYEKEWLTKFIKSSQSMVAAGDEQAVKLFNEFLIPMPDPPINEDQISTLLTYIKEQSQPIEEEITSVADVIEKPGQSSLVKVETSPDRGSFGFIEIILLSVMGIEIFTIFILISVVFMISKHINGLK